MARNAVRQRSLRPGSNCLYAGTLSPATYDEHTRRHTARGIRIYARCTRKRCNNAEMLKERKRGGAVGRTALTVLNFFFQPEELLRRIPRAARPSRLEPWRIGGLSEEQKLMSDSYLFDMSRILATGAAHAN